MHWNPNSVTMIGTAYGRYSSKPFGIRLADRMQHIYILGLHVGINAIQFLLN